MRNPSVAANRRDADQLHDDAMRWQHENRSRDAAKYEE
jgi:hypothetical protein